MSTTESARAVTDDQPVSQPSNPSWTEPTAYSFDAYEEVTGFPVVPIDKEELDRRRRGDFSGRSMEEEKRREMDQNLESQESELDAELAAALQEDTPSGADSEDADNAYSPASMIAKKLRPGVMPKNDGTDEVLYLPPKDAHKYYAAGMFFVDEQRFGNVLWLYAMQFCILTRFFSFRKAAFAWRSLAALLLANAEVGSFKMFLRNLPLLRYNWLCHCFPPFFFRSLFCSCFWFIFNFWFSKW